MIRCRHHCSLEADRPAPSPTARNQTTLSSLAPVISDNRYPSVSDSQSNPAGRGRPRILHQPELLGRPTYRVMSPTAAASPSAEVFRPTPPPQTAYPGTQPHWPTQLARAAIPTRSLGAGPGVHRSLARLGCGWLRIIGFRGVTSILYPVGNDHTNL